MACNSAGNPSRYGRLRDLVPTRRPPPLQVIVAKTWRVQLANADTLDFIVIDKEGDQMHGWIPQRLIAAFQNQIRENSVITIADFRVIERRNDYCSPLTNKYNIVFTQATRVQHGRAYLRCKPEQFTFTEFERLPLMLRKENNLADVIGVLEVVGQTRYVSSTRKLRELYICNERDETLKVNFWDEDIALINTSLTTGNATPTLAITSTAVTDFGGKIGVTASHETKIFVDPDIAPAIELCRKITMHSQRTSGKRMLLSNPAPIQGCSFCETSAHQVCADQHSGRFCRTTCRTKVTMIGDDYWCFPYDVAETHDFKKPKLQIQDSSERSFFNGKAIATTAIDLVDVGTAQIHTLNNKPGTVAKEVHNHLIKVVGKEYLFQVRVDADNVQNPDKALPVSSISNVAIPSKRMKTPPACMLC